MSSTPRVTTRLTDYMATTPFYRSPVRGATGLLRIPCMVMMEVGGNFPSPQFYDRAVNIERQPARAAYHTHTRRDDRWAVSACRGPEIRAGLRCLDWVH